MAILTLTTDWGVCDPAVGSFKGSLLQQNADLNIIDITHNIPRFDTLTAAYIMKTTFRKFPKGTIHYIGLTGPEDSTDEFPFVVVEADGHILVGYDSGVFSLILDQEEEKKVYSLKARNHGDRKENEHILVEALVHLAKGKKPESIGEPREQVSVSYFTVPTIDANTIRGTIIYVDSFGNAVLNITKEMFEKEHKNREFVIYMRRSEYTISKIGKSYEDAAVSEIVAFFNTNDHLEIALNKTQASGLLGLKVMDAIRIEFK